ncbi:MAG: hypothetical protein KDB18_14080, partial [Salinibacterium sp.]|nr:hypothetical protein [Salinibacterium sp.]
MIDSAIEVDPADWRHQDDRARYALYLGKEGIGKEALAKANDLAPAGGVWRNNMNKVMTVLERDYETVTTPYFALKFHRDEVKVLSRVMAPFLDRSYEEFTKTYAFRPTTPLVFEVMKRHEEFSVRTMGTLGLGALGVCFGPTVFMDSPSAQRPGTYNWAGTAHHEIALIFTLLASRGRVPRWLTEGLSSWEEVRRSESWGRDMESLLDDALHNDKLFGVREFDAGFRTSRIIFAYYQGEQVCRWIEETWGIEAIRKMLELFGQDHQIDFVLDKALGLTPEAFDAAFRAFVAKKLEPLKRVPNWDEDARRGFRLAIAEGRDVEENRLKLAWAWFKAGKSVDSDEVLKPLLDEGYYEHPLMDLLLGMRALRGKRIQAAKDAFAKVIAAGHDDHDMYYALAQIAEQEGDDDTAAAMWQKAAATNPWVTNPQASPWLALARIARAAGDQEAWAGYVARYCGLNDTALELR